MDRSLGSLSPSRGGVNPSKYGNMPSASSDSQINNILLDYRQLQSQMNQFVGARFIFECGVKLDAEPLTIATAAVIFHRFFKEVDEKSYDVFLIAATSLYLAGKVEGQLLRVRDVINVCYATIHRNSHPLDLGDKYWSFRDAIVQAELLMMRTLSFQVSIIHPHKYMVHYLKTLEEWMGSETMSKAPVARTAWALLQDFHHDSSILKYPPQAVAIGAIQLSLLSYGAQVPLSTNEGRNDWKQIMYPELKPEMQEEIIVKILAVYEKENELLAAAMTREISNGKSL